MNDFGRYWEKVAVLGAAGKMGKGIALLLLIEMARQEALNKKRVGGGDFRLHLIDSQEELLYQLRDYFHSHLVRYAEKNIILLRKVFESRDDLVSNREIIDEFVEGALSNLRFSTTSEASVGSLMVFEAIVEDLEVKVQVLEKIKSVVPPEAFFFTNTSSIPIHILAERAGLQGKIIGFHFYNPPPVQKLVEIIVPDEINLLLLSLSKEVGLRLEKILVPSKDIAGFIGNGHFIREIAFACQMVDKLSKEMPHLDAILIVDKMTRDILLRPMGIFQLIDYVGIDVSNRIATVMSKYISDALFNQKLIAEMLISGQLGGQHLDGTQKKGFFNYAKGDQQAIYNISLNAYETIDEEWKLEIEKYLDFKPELTWKALSKDKDAGLKLEDYEKRLISDKSRGALLASEYLTHSRSIEKHLVEAHVAATLEDVHKVLKNGFFQVLV